jgi:hypothetical protein
MTDTPHDQFRKALTAALDFDETYNDGPVGRILAQDANGNYLVSLEDVPTHFFHTGAAAADDIRAFIAAGGDICVLEDYAAFVLRSSGIIKADSSADIDALNGWIAAHSVAISALPGFRQKLDNLLQAQYALKHAVEAREEALVDFHSKPGALFLHNDPITAVEKLFALPLPAQAMSDLISQIENDSNTLDGLQRAVIGFITDRIGVGINSHPAFCEFLDENREVLALLFEDEKIRTFDNIAADLKRSALSSQADSLAPMTKSAKNGSITQSRWARIFRRHL